MNETLQVALALIHDDRGWLVSRRSAGRIFAGLWEFPGGKIGPRETPQSAAVRETREETGLLVEPLGSLGEVEDAHGGKRVRLHLILCRPLSGEAAARDPAVDEVHWVSLEELEKLPMPPVNAQIIARLRAR